MGFAQGSPFGGKFTGFFHDWEEVRGKGYSAAFCQRASDQVHWDIKQAQRFAVGEVKFVFIKRGKGIGVS